MAHLWKALTDRCEAVAAAWNRFWFTPADPATLGAIRIATGLVLLYFYGLVTFELLDSVGPHAWIDSRATEQIYSLPQADGSPAPGYAQSVLFYIQHPAGVWLFHILFLAAIVGFTVGYYSRVMAVAVWLGHLSHVYRAFMWFGLDSILAMLTFYQIFGPSGAALSLDRRGRKDEPVVPLWSANLVVRMIQIHVCVVYFCAGMSKLQGARWWDGTAVWITMMMSEFAPVNMTWLAHLGDFPCLLLSHLGVALTLFLEIGFVFLIWNPSLRSTMLFLAFVMHFGIGLFMGMGSFGAAMLTGCLAFISPAATRAFVQRWFAPKAVENPVLLPASRPSARAA